MTSPTTAAKWQDPPATEGRAQIPGEEQLSEEDEQEAEEE